MANVWPMAEQRLNLFLGFPVGCRVACEFTNIRSYPHSGNEHAIVDPRWTPASDLCCGCVFESRIDYCGLFGWNLVKSTDTEVILTCSEVDAMAVRQETGRLSVALPKGDSVLPQKVCCDFLLGKIEG